MCSRADDLALAVLAAPVALLYNASNANEHQFIFYLHLGDPAQQTKSFTDLQIL